MIGAVAAGDCIHSYMQKIIWQAYSLEQWKVETVKQRQAKAGQNWRAKDHFSTRTGKAATQAHHWGRRVERGDINPKDDEMQ